MTRLAMVTLVAVCFVPLPVSAQGLADAARKAEEVRKSSGGSVRAFSDKDLTPALNTDGHQISTHELTVQNFQAFKNTRRAYVKLLMSDGGLRGRMQARMAETRSVDAAVAAWKEEQAVLSLIRENGTTPREFLLTELAVAQAVLVMKALEHEAAPGELPPTVQRNIAFVKAHWIEIETFAREIQSLASQMP